MPQSNAASTCATELAAHQLGGKNECATAAEEAARVALASGVFREGLTPRLTGAGGPPGPQGTKAGHDNAEGMASFGVRVEPTVRLGRVGSFWQVGSCFVGFVSP